MMAGERDTLIADLRERTQAIADAFTPLERIGHGQRIGEIVARLAAISSPAGSKAFRAWFGASVVRDGQGWPQVVYRGEHGAYDGGPGVGTMLGSITFTDDPKVAGLYAADPDEPGLVPERPRVIAAYLRIENPIFDNRMDPFVELAELERKLGQDEAVRIARKFEDCIEGTGNWIEGLSAEFRSVGAMMDAVPERVGELYFNAYPFLDDPEEVARLRAAGFDGAVHMGNGESDDALEFRVFSAGQIKSATGNSGRFDPAVESIMDGAAPTRTWRMVEMPRC